MKNYFSLFHLPTQFALDIDRLESCYLELQQQFHPDKNDNLDNLENSILINQAYKILSDDFYRACHLLQLKNIDIEDDECPIKPNMATLQEILELQEQISTHDNLAEIIALKNTIKLDIENLITAFSYAYEANKTADATQLLIKTKYLKKSLLDLKNKEKNFL